MEMIVSREFIFKWINHNNGPRFWAFTPCQVHNELLSKVTEKHCYSDSVLRVNASLYGRESCCYPHVSQNTWLLQCFCLSGALEERELLLVTGERCWLCSYTLNIEVWEFYVSLLPSLLPSFPPFLTSVLPSFLLLFFKDNIKSEMQFAEYFNFELSWPIESSHYENYWFNHVLMELSTKAFMEHKSRCIYFSPGDLA